MSSLLYLKDVCFGHSGQAEYIVENANWELPEGQKVGLLGMNGAGKSTLLHLISGKLQADKGSLERRFSSLFILDQEDRAEGNQTARNYLLSLDINALEVLQEMDKAEMNGIPEPLIYADLTQTFLELGGFQLLADIDRASVAFGFSPADLNRPVDSFSGGERRLLKLASGFIRLHDLYLLDEPTNYLDGEAVNLLIGALRKIDSTVLMVSHDRWFLDQVASQILELERKTLRLWSGNYSKFYSSKNAERLAAERKAEKLESEIAKLKIVARNYEGWGRDREKDKYRLSKEEGSVDKGYIGTKAAKLQKTSSQAKNRVAARIEALEKEKPWLEKQYRLEFAPVESRLGWAIDAVGLEHKWGERTLFSGLDFRLGWGERVHLEGENGSGKSTLIALLLGQIPVQKGEIRRASRLTIGYLPQLGTLLDSGEVIQNLFRDNPQDARNLLGALKVSGDIFRKKVGELSEGQQRKLSLVRIILDKPNLLILDEPTSHLDYQSVELLEGMLLEFAGAVLFTSHDRYLADKIATAMIRIDKCPI